MCVCVCVLSVLVCPTRVECAALWVGGVTDVDFQGLLLRTCIEPIDVGRALAALDFRIHSGRT